MWHLLALIAAVGLTSFIVPQTHHVNAQAVIPNWLDQTFTFGWPGTENSTQTRCRVLNITFANRPSAVPTPTEPYTIVLSRAGYTPLVVNAGSKPSFLWKVNVDLGGPYLLSAYDSAGATGGTGLSFNVVADTINNATCSSAGMKASTLDFTVSGTPSQCGMVPMTVSGGQPPYVVNFLGENYPPKRATFAAGNIDWIIDLKAGINAYFSVTDTLGNGAVSQFFNIAASANSTCLATAQTLAPGSPALSTVYPGTGVASSTGTAAGATSTSKSSSNPTLRISNTVLAMAVFGAIVATLPL
ncbi:hypothetical protein FRB95_012962 [Tulasnella sp. JGI-2019a]|nr:hypothetical protein FRB95_012962 [Tulasnella sp. JGI-2019a]